MIVGLLISGCIFLLLFLLERWHPLRQPRRELRRRLGTNFLVTALAFVVNASVVQPAAQGAIAWTAQQPFGLVPFLPVPAVVRGAIAFLLLDLSFYYWHRLNHRSSFLWRFHNVHHLDPDLDVSTGFRFHFVEILLSAGFRVLQVGLIGVSLPVFLIYETIFQANTLFHHSNVKLPLSLERWLNRVLVTPRMHGIHHSQIQTETNANFSVVFPWWDRLHHTLRLNIPQSLIVIGVPAYDRAEDNQVANLLLLPFRCQRDYWSGVEPSIARGPDLGHDPTQMIDREPATQTVVDPSL